MEFIDFIPLPEARRRIIESLAGIRMDRDRVSLAAALGRVAFEAVKARDAVPPFSRSSVDGFAVRSRDTHGAGEAAPAMLQVIGEIQMGRPTELNLKAGQAGQIPTGGMLPAGADAVIMLEHVEQLDRLTLLVGKAVAPGENIVQAGEDIAAGASVLTAGQRIGPQTIGLLAACGIAELSVCRKPRVAILSTGDEVVDVDQVLSPGQVRDINAYALAALLAELGCDPFRLGIVRDDYQALHDAIAAAVREYDLVILSGGSSVGARDYAVRALEAIGGPGLVFHGVSIKPGRPTLFGMLGSVPVFGLPGHPMAAMTVCDQLVRIAIRTLLGQTPSPIAAEVMAQMGRSVASVPGRDDYIPVRLYQTAEGYRAEPLLGKSGLISTLARAHGIVRIPAEKGGLYPGDPVAVRLLDSEGMEE